MDIQGANLGFSSKEATRKNRGQWIVLFLCFLTSGLLVFVIFSHYPPFYERKKDLIGRLITAGVFLAITLMVRSRDRLEQYWLIPFAFFTGLTVISVDADLRLSKYNLPAPGIMEDSPVGLAVDKLESSLMGIALVLIQNRLAVQNLGSLYIRRGNLRLGLSVGLTALVLMLAVLLILAWTVAGWYWLDR